MNDSVQDYSASTIENLIDAMLACNLQVEQIDQTCIPADLIVKLATTKRNPKLRFSLSELYRMGYFGRHDAVNGYIWTLATWNCSLDYDDKFRLAQTQQYYEFMLSSSEQGEAILALGQVLLSSEQRGFECGNPFNGRWWGWEDDAIPARPGERDFKAEFQEWLLVGGYSESEITEILAKCPPSNGPTRMERIKEDMLGHLNPTK